MAIPIPAQPLSKKTGMGKLLGIGAGAGISGGLLGGLFTQNPAGASNQSSVAAPPMNTTNQDPSSQYSYSQSQGGYDQGYYNSTTSPGQGYGSQDAYAPTGYDQGGYGQGGYDQGGYGQGPDNLDPYGQQTGGYDQGGDYSQGTDDYSTQYDQGGYDEQAQNNMDAEEIGNEAESQAWENSLDLVS